MEHVTDDGRTSDLRGIEHLSFHEFVVIEGYRITLVKFH
jgi:hypothetical protein